MGCCYKEREREKYRGLNIYRLVSVAEKSQRAKNRADAHSCSAMFCDTRVHKQETFERSLPVMDADRCQCMYSSSGIEASLLVSSESKQFFSR